VRVEPGYEFTPRPIGPSSRWRAAATAFACIAFIGLVIVKPWGEPMTAEEPIPAPSRPSPSAATSPSLLPSDAPAAADASAGRAVLSWPVASTRPRAIGYGVAEAESLAVATADRSHGWAVGDGGSGPRFVHDEAWLAWRAVAVAAAGETPTSIVVWPGTGLCTGLPMLQDRPTFVAVLAPPGVPPGGRITGWWSDGTRVAALAGSIRQVPATGAPRLQFLERIDGSRWPSGRYELHISSAERTVALTFCF
jgi:hypothetical protein